MKKIDVSNAKERKKKRVKNKLKKALATILLALTVTGSATGIIASAGFGSGIAVLAEGTEIIKSGISGKKMIFSDLDIKQGLAISDFEKITVTKIPLSTEGTLLLAGRRVGEGTVIKRKNIGALVFVPASRDVGEARFSFTTEDFAEGAEVTLVMKFTDKVNYAPKVENKTDTTSKIKTQREVAVFGKMEATDSESDELEYIVISYPKHGNLKINGKNSGEFCYTPPKGFVGEDEFVYVARDSWGNYSKPATLEITVTERMSEVVYTDMSGHENYNAALAVTALGIMDGRLIGDGVYFMPDSTLTREEFVSMAMKAVGIKPDKSLTATFFDDNESLSPALVGYIATAQKMGIVTGEFKDGALLFSPKENITKYEAALVMANILERALTEETGAPALETDAPVFAESAVSAMYSLGIFEEGADTKTATPVTKAAAAEYLCKLAGV